MRGLIWILALVGLITLAAMATRPSEEKAEAALKDQLLTALAQQEIDPSRGAGGTLALGLCRLSPDDCYDLLRSGVDAQYTDHTLYSRFQIAGFGKTADCYGAFTKVFCPGGLRDE